MKNITATNNRRTDSETHDFYATDPKAMEMLLAVETFSDTVWECAVGQGHLADVLKRKGYKVRASDLIDRGYANTEIIDFLSQCDTWEGDIITNPPYKYAKDFVETSMQLTSGKVAMFLKLTFLESKGRKELFEKYPPKVVYVFRGRIECGKNGVFVGRSAVAYAWFIWEREFKGEPIIRWL